MATETIIKVKFREPPFPNKPTKTEFFFGSLAAIYEVFAPSDIGCRVENLWNVGVSDGHPYENALCRITKEPVIRKQQRKPSKQRNDGGQ